MNISRTTLSSKILQGKKDHFSKLCVEAVLKLHVKLIYYDLI
jgi:chaperonin GroEL (HSP60 family)